MDGLGDLPFWLLVSGVGIGLLLAAGLIAWRQIPLDGLAERRRREHLIVGSTLMFLGFGAFDLSWVLGLAFIIGGIVYAYLGTRAGARPQLR